MEVYDTSTPSTISFKDLDIGCVFFDNEERIYAMRIANLEDGDGIANVVCLETGNLYFYENDYKVVHVKAKIEVYA